jgi:hypothetical protein
MSSSVPQLPPAQDGLPKDGDQGPGQFELGSSPQHEDGRNEIARPGQVETGRGQLNALFKSLQRPADKKCFTMICTDGVCRVIHYLPTPPDQPTDYEIYDAKPMSPEIIKAFLDTQPWNQEKEDRFRGADGRKIPQE